MAEPLDARVRLDPAGPARERPGPDPDPPDLRPAERAEEDGRSRLGGKPEDDGNAAVGGLLLVLLLEGGKDPEPTRGLVRRRMDREARLSVHAAEHHPSEGVRSHAH